MNKGDSHNEPVTHTDTTAVNAFTPGRSCRNLRWTGRNNIIEQRHLLVSEAKHLTYAKKAFYLTSLLFNDSLILTQPLT